ncbi:MAG: isochorismatase family cysteine hydrolase [Pseudomonadota bacterium]
MRENKIDYKRSALLIIDVQRYFFDPDGGAFLEGAPAILPNILKLIAAFRAAGLPVAFTRQAHRKGEPTGQMGRWWNDKLPWDGTPDAELIRELAPKDGDFLIAKTSYSAFEGTRLEEHLRKNGVTTTVICGVMTNLCVETTARHAFIRDFQPAVVEDACAANTPEHHRASILNLSYGFAFIEKTDGLIAKLLSLQ